MARLTVRLTDELHQRLRAAAGGRSLNLFAVEAIAEKIARTGVDDLRAEIAELRRRIDALERRTQR